MNYIHFWLFYLYILLTNINISYIIYINLKNRSVSMSVKSMTGYGRAVKSFDGRDISIDIKSVNHRYFDFNSKISKDYFFLEDKIKSKINEHIVRGKVDFYLYIDSDKQAGYEVVINEQLAKGYSDAFKLLSKKFKVKNDLSATFFSRVSDVIKLKKAEIDEGELTQQVMEVLDEAILSFNQMRTIEGNKLCEYIFENLDIILKTVSEIESLAPESIEKYKIRLKAKLDEALEGREYDEQRVITETAIFADKIDVGEEMVRLRSHISQFRDLLNSNGVAVGKKLDFIVQEMNREINTIGSKCNSIEITQRVVDTKSVIEKIREQIQNIE